MLARAGSFEVNEKTQFFSHNGIFSNLTSSHSDKEEKNVIKNRGRTSVISFSKGEFQSLILYIIFFFFYSFHKR